MLTVRPVVAAAAVEAVVARPVGAAAAVVVVGPREIQRRIFMKSQKKK